MPRLILLQVLFVWTVSLTEKLVPQNEPKQVLQTLQDAQIENLNLTLIKSANFSTNDSDSQAIRPRIDAEGYLMCNTDPRLKLCENDALYPEKEIILLLKEASDTKSSGAESNVILPEDTFDYEANNILPPPCEVRTLLYHPRAGFSVNLGHVYIINIKEYSQPVVLHVCASYMSKCGNSNEGENGICQQRYGLATMKIIHPFEHKIVETHLEVPISCECQKPILDQLKKHMIKEKNAATNLITAFIEHILLMFCIFVVM